MSEKIYAWLLRLYPNHFRRAYGDAALQLFRDRARDERGFLSGLRLWLDLLADLAISVPHEYRYTRTAVAGSAQPCWDGTPSFHVLEDEAPRPGALLYGGILSLVVYGSVLFVIGHGRSHFPLSDSNVQQRPSYALSPTSRRPVGEPTRDPGEMRIAPGQVATGVSRLTPNGAKASSGFRSKILGMLASFRFLQSQAQHPKPQNASNEMIRAGVEDVKADAAERHRVIDRAIANLKEYYVYPDVAQKMADALLAHEKSGDDNAETDGEAFADLLTRQMRDVSHDGHLRLVYSQSSTPDLPPGPTPEMLARYRQDMERNHCTFEKVEILPHNIGYLKFNEFPDPSLCRPSVVASMNRLGHVDAMIFDLRNNHGGHGITLGTKVCPRRICPQGIQAKCRSLTTECNFPRNGVSGNFNAPNPLDL